MQKAEKKYRWDIKEGLQNSYCTCKAVNFGLGSAGAETSLSFEVVCVEIVAHLQYSTVTVRRGVSKYCSIRF